MFVWTAFLVLSQPFEAARVALVGPPVTQATAGTLFSDDFSTEPDLKRYFEIDRGQGSFRWERDGGMSGGGVVCTFRQGQVSAGGLKVLVGTNPFHRGHATDKTLNELYFRVYVQHDAGWQGNPAKMLRATALNADWSQGMMAHVWGGKGSVLCIDPATGIRDGKKVSTKYNDFPNLKWLGLRQGMTPIFSTEESGRWVCVEAHVKLDDPGKRNGLMELWVDGKIDAHVEGLEFHGTWNEQGIDAVFLENYWNSGSIKEQTRRFDDWVISQKPIGPVQVGSNPSLSLRPGTQPAWTQVELLGEDDQPVWRSKPLSSTAASVRVDAESGTWLKPNATQKGLLPSTYWTRTRTAGDASSKPGEWSSWSLPHAPFTVTADPAVGL